MKTFIVGLTGGIGSGKTAASDWFTEKGVNVVDADIVAREIVSKNSPTLLAIKNEFGDWVIQPSGTLDRKKLRTYIFKHPDAKKTLEAITHPAIRTNIERKLLSSNSNITLLVVPLLFEGGTNGLAKLCDRTLVVDVPVELQKKRAAERDEQSVEDINRIIATQISREQRLLLADDVVDNSGNLAGLYAQLQPLYDKYQRLSKVNQN